MTDFDCLQLTFQLASQGTALVSPNPLVGSIVVRDGVIVGKGYHRYDDVKHAEVWALEEAGPRAQGATVYVNLEPCCHGPGKRTPPCVNALIEAGVTRVVASMVDPNPHVDGRGFAELSRAGIETSVGGCELEAQRLNEKYITYAKTARPFVHLKLACSLDGRIATRMGDAKWITGEEARAASQTLRHEYDAILVGINTVLADDPLLTDRTGRLRHRELQRVVLDAGLRLPPDSELARTANELPVIVFTARVDAGAADSQDWPLGFAAGFNARRGALESLGIMVVDVPSRGGNLDLGEVLDELARRRVTSLMVEGGGEVAGSFIDDGLVDKLTFFYSAKIIGGRESVPAIGGHGFGSLAAVCNLEKVDIIRRGPDWEVTGYPDGRSRKKPKE